jgi:hypothetical protein
MNTPNNYLTSLAADINAALTRDETNHDEWIAIKLDLCRLFADARSRFKDNVSFGKWRLKEIGSAVNDKDCTAYAAMGADLARAKIVFDKTTRSSIQHIYANEFPDRSAHVSGTTSTPKSKPLSPKKVQTYATMKAAAAHGATIDQLATRHNVSEEHVKEVLDTQLPPSEDDLVAQPISVTAQAKLDAHQRKLDKEFAWAVRQKVAAEVDEAVKRLEKVWKDNLGKLEAAWKRRGKVFTKAEYGTLLRVIHPDTGANADEAQRNEAFRLFNDRKIKLLDENDFSTAAARAPISRSLEEMMAARAKVKAENSERAKKAAATRKAKQQEQSA